MSCWSLPEQTSLRGAVAAARLYGGRPRYVSMLSATHPQLPFTQAKTYINACPALAIYFTPKTKSRNHSSTKSLPPTSNTTTNGSFSNLITQTSASSTRCVALGG